MILQESLTQVNPDGRVAPRLAERWQWERDGRQLRIVLRPNVRFHDGSLLTAERVASLLRTLASNERAWAAYPALQQVVDIIAEGEDEVLVRVSQPSAFLLEDLSIPLTSGSDVVSLGAYRLSQSDNGSTTEVVLERHEGYYQGPPAIDRIAVRPYADLRSAWAALLRGEVAMVSDVGAGAVEFIRDDDDVRVLSWERWFQFIVTFNSGRGALQSPTVRRALNIAIDRDALIRRVIPGAGRPANGPIWPNHWAHDGDVPGFSFDQSSAKSLLDAAGYRAGRGAAAAGFPHARFRFTCLIPEGFSVLERIGLEVQRQLYDVGVDMRFETLPAAEIEQRVATGKFEAVLLDMISGPSLGRPYTFWRSARHFKGRNAFGYESPEAEQLFDILRSSVNEAAVRSATSRLQRVMMQNPPALFLAWNTRARAVRREFAVYQEPGRDPLSTLWRWAPQASVRSAALR